MEAAGLRQDLGILGCNEEGRRGGKEKEGRGGENTGIYSVDYARIYRQGILEVLRDEMHMFVPCFKKKRKSKANGASGMAQ